MTRAHRPTHLKRACEGAFSLSAAEKTVSRARSTHVTPRKDADHPDQPGIPPLTDMDPSRGPVLFPPSAHAAHLKRLTTPRSRT